MRSTSRVRSMARLSLALPALARCERPSVASPKFCRDQPGRLAHGPEEKHGATGRAAGISSIACHPLRWAPLVGERCPAAAHREAAQKWQAETEKLAAPAPALAAFRGGPAAARLRRRDLRHALVADAGEEQDLRALRVRRLNPARRLRIALWKRDHVPHLGNPIAPLSRNGA